jgi:hypothetical protein
MPQITVKFGQPLSLTIGQRSVTLDLPEGCTATGLLEELAQRYPGFDTAFRGENLGRSTPYIFFLDGRPVTPPNFDATRVQAGDGVQLVLPGGGGLNG